MRGLLTIQSDFQAYVLGDGQGASAIEAAIVSQGRLASAERLAIYHNAYRARLREALGEAYDKTWSYAGDELFAELAEGYLAAHPSTFRNLRWFGGSFATHVAQALPDYPVVAELARFEWALGVAFDAPDAQALTREDMAAVAPEAWETMRFGWHPSLQLLDLAHNSVALWQALDGATEPPDTLDAPQCWAVWRRDNQPHFRSLDPLEAAALRALAEGRTFGEVCLLAGGDEALMRRLAGYLQNWLAQAMLTA